MCSYTFIVEYSIAKLFCICQSVRTEINEGESGSPSTVGNALKQSHHASVQVEVKNPRCASVNISIQKSAHAAINYTGTLNESVWK